MYEFMDRTLADSFTFYRVPKLLFTDPEFRKMTAESRILYGLLLDRTGLSWMNDWRDELEKARLIERRKQGLGRPDRIYVKSFIRTEDTKTAV